MTDIVAELLDFTTRDHDRGCTGHEYVCSCGYDTEIEAAVKKAASEIERLRLSLSEAIAERDAAFEMSKCECGPDEACRNLVEARATGRREGMEAIIAIAEDYANDAMPGSGYRLACVDIAAAIRAAMEK